MRCMQAEEVLQTFAKDFRQFWEVVSNKEASVDMVDACLKGAYSLGVMQPQYRCWLPLSKIGETMAILHIMRCNLSLDRGDLAQSVHDAQAAVALTIIPGSSACSPKAMSAMWFAQACRALGRVSVVRIPPSFSFLCGAIWFWRLLTCAHGIPPSNLIEQHKHWVCALCCQALEYVPTPPPQASKF